MMIKRVWCLTFLLLTITGSNYALAQNVVLDNSWVTGPVLQAALAETKVLNKDIVVYHWLDRKNISTAGGGVLPATGYLPPQDQVVQETVQSNIASRMKLFWDLNIAITGKDAQGETMAPNGLYVAINPVISRQWGTMFYQMTLPGGAAGMRFIDGRSRNRHMGQALKDALTSKGCLNKNTMRDLIKSRTNEVVCRKMLIELADATDSSAFMYNFNREPLPNCNQWSPAFVLIKPNSIRQNSIVPFSIELPSQDDGFNENRAMINGMFSLALQSKVLNHQPPFRSSELQTVSEAEVRLGVADQLYGCQVNNMPRQ